MWSFKQKANVAELTEKRDVKGLLEFATQDVPTCDEILKSKDKNSLALDMEKAVSALGQFGGPQCVDVLLTIMGDSKKFLLHNSCVKALGALADRRAVRQVISSLGKAQTQQRANQRLSQLEKFHNWEPDLDGHVEALGNLGDPEAIPALRELSESLKDTSLYASASYRDRMAEAIRKSLAKLEGTQESPAEETKRLLDRFVANILHGFELEQRIAQIGEAAIPELKRRIRLDGNDSRAAMIAIQKMPPTLAAPMVAEALKCSYSATRHFAVEYMERHAREFRDIAAERSQVEKDKALAAKLRHIANG
jgi:HEAT repeat protein